MRYGYNDNDARKIGIGELLSSGSTYDRDTLNSQRKRNEVALDFQLEWNPDSMSSLIFRPNFNYSHTAIDNNERTHNLNQRVTGDQTSQAWGGTSGDNLSAGGLLLYVRRLNNRDAISRSVPRRVTTMPPPMSTTRSTPFSTSTTVQER